MQFSHTMSNSLTFDICIRQAGVREVLIVQKKKFNCTFFDLCQSIENLLMFLKEDLYRGIIKVFRFEFIQC